MTDKKLSDTIKQNLDNIEKEVKNNNLDWVHANVGEEGSSKSSLAILMAEYLDPDFDAEKQVAMSAKEFRVKASKLDSFKPLVYDEGIEGLFSRESMTKENRKTVKFLRKCRDMNLFIFLCTPKFLEFDKAIREHRIKSLTRCVKQGWGWFYGKSEIKKYLDKQRWPDPPMRGAWNDPAETIPEIWNQYKAKKQSDIKELEEDQDEEEEINWLSVGEFGDRLGIHNDTVRRWCEKGKVRHGRLPNGDRRIPESEISKVVSDPESPNAKDKGEKADIKHS